MEIICLGKLLGSELAGVFAATSKIAGESAEGG